MLDGLKMRGCVTLISIPRTDVMRSVFRGGGGDGGGSGGGSGGGIGDGGD
jgi:hypothetical protein